jgi:hypothetical protein
MHHRSASFERSAEGSRASSNKRGAIGDINENHLFGKKESKIMLHYSEEFVQMMAKSFCIMTSSLVREAHAIVERATSVAQAKIETDSRT